MENPSSYVHSNIAGFVNLLEICKIANPQPAIVCASSSSVYGLNTKIPFSEKDRTNQPASLYAATKKAGEEITHTYNHICGLSLTGLQFLLFNGPIWRIFFSLFHKDILKGKVIPVFEAANDRTARTAARVQLGEHAAGASFGSCWDFGEIVES
ncbi:putative UDP-glucuronate 4-epimerase [Helianthus annuus]|uniref:UDP-glucuronate 4-epimerase n=1 Tax=Helianthus annuus TaxID=4232 RepID=A0A9K3NL38_HELAN|nr:putative UDP-glucuronate 4-epimerase [Helianthus annuus]